jgi:hypothetical protein
MENNDRSDFISQLEYYDIIFKIEGEKIIVGDPDSMDQLDLDNNRFLSIPDNVVFVNLGMLWLNRVTHLGNNVSFLNDGFINLENLHSDLPPSTEFKNKGFVDLRRLIRLSPETKFENSDGVYLLSIKSDDVPDNVFFLNGGTIAFSDFNLKELENHDIEAFVIPSIKMGMLMNSMRKRNLFTKSK